MSKMPKRNTQVSIVDSFNFDGWDMREIKAWLLNPEFPDQSATFTDKYDKRYLFEVSDGVAEKRSDNLSDPLANLRVYSEGFVTTVNKLEPTPELLSFLKVYNRAIVTLGNLISAQLPPSDEEIKRLTVEGPIN